MLDSKSVGMKASINQKIVGRRELISEKKA